MSEESEAPRANADTVVDRVPAALREALAGIALPLAIVGGFVRDALLDRPNHDIDLAVDGDAEAAARTLARTLRGAVVPLDGERGTYRIALRQPLDGIEALDLTRLRAPSLEEDLRLRDLTINAIATTFGADGPRIVDPTGGLDDLAAGVIRIAGPRSFVDDPLRPLRAARFAAQLGFTIDHATVRAARDAAPRLAKAAAERRRDELCRILASDDAERGARLLDELGLLSVLLPDLDAGRGFVQPREHYFDVFEHNLHALAAMGLILRAEPPADESEHALWAVVQPLFGLMPDLRAKLNAVVAEERPLRVTLKFVALLHDIAKPETCSFEPDTGRMRFYGHPEVGARRAAALARGLRFSAREIAYIERLITEHLRPGMLAAPGEQPTRRALYKFARDLGDELPDLLLLHLADHAAVRGPLLTLREWERHVAHFTWLLGILYGEEHVARPPKLIDGNDVQRELGLPPGPLIGRLLEAVREAQADGEIGDRDAALGLARRLAAEEGATNG